MDESVYSPTTAPNPKTKCFLVPTETLDLKRFCVKTGQVIFSLVAFLQEELVHSCSSCAPLYFFEFVSCSSFFFTLLLLVLLSTPLHQRIGVAASCWSILDFFYTVTVFVFFFIASIAFSANNTGSDLEKSAAAFGFLASLVFLVDLVLFFHTRGFPWNQEHQEHQEHQANGPVTPPEAERLQENGA